MRLTNILIPRTKASNVFCQLCHGKNSMASNLKPPVRCAANKKINPASAIIINGFFVQARKASKVVTSSMANLIIKKWIGRNKANIIPDIL